MNVVPGLGPTCRNPFRSIVVRAVEVVYAVDEALRIIGSNERPDPPAVDVTPRAGVGHGVSEAPRGLLYHRYELDSAGLIRTPTIVPPTSQNQAAIEHDLRGTRRPLELAQRAKGPYRRRARNGQLTVCSGPRDCSSCPRRTAAGCSPRPRSGG